MRFQTLASSSAGNAAVLSLGEEHLLIDAGISCLRLRRGLEEMGLRLEDLTAVLITHAHSDHTAGLATLLKRCDAPILCTEETARQLCYRTAGLERRLSPFPLGGQREVGGCLVTSVPTSHDIPGSTGFRFDWGGSSLGYLTDTGVIPREAECLLGVDLLYLEANHDVETLRSGPYPYYLKARVLGDQGHLSNDTAARFAQAAALRGTGNIILAHLSQENNTPQMAFRTVETALRGADYRGQLSVAPRAGLSPAHETEAAACRK